MSLNWCQSLTTDVIVSQPVSESLNWSQNLSRVSLFQLVSMSLNWCQSFSTDVIVSQLMSMSLNWCRCLSTGVDVSQLVPLSISWCTATFCQTWHIRTTVINLNERLIFLKENWKIVSNKYAQTKLEKRWEFIEVFREGGHYVHFGNHCIYLQLPYLTEHFAHLLCDNFISWQKIIFYRNHYYIYHKFSFCIFYFVCPTKRVKTEPNVFDL